MEVFIMIKNDLRKNGFSEDYKEPRESPISVIWTILTLTIIAVSFFGVLNLAKEFRGEDAIDPLMLIIGFIFGLFGLPIGIVVFLLLFLAVYFALKTIMTLLVCKDKINSIRIRILKGRGIPVCYCKEALKVWQTVLIYIAPVAFMYFSLLTLSIISGGSHILYLPMIVLLSLLMAFDLTLVLHVLFYKVKDGIDYISIENHVYQMTMFKKPVEENKKVTGRLKKI
jgi:hypothetical protein